ncbi:MAG: hypothetical protein WCT01_03945 [Candidatus Shapirobacteria bacterium]
MAEGMFSHASLMDALGMGRKADGREPEIRQGKLGESAVKVSHVCLWFDAPEMRIIHGCPNSCDGTRCRNVTVSRV